MGERKNVMDSLEFYSPKKDYAADETTGWLEEWISECEFHI
jgi:hypothetical protein